MSPCAEVDEKLELRSDSYVSAITDCNQGPTRVFSSDRLISAFPPADHVGLELSLICEVERVYVWLDEEEGLFRVITIVDANDSALRDRIYERELAIIEALPKYNFDFHVLPRVGHALSDLVDYADKPAYSKR
jgi:hypothetical protein